LLKLLELERLLSLFPGIGLPVKLAIKASMSNAGPTLVKLAKLRCVKRGSSGVTAFILICYIGLGYEKEFKMKTILSTVTVVLSKIRVSRLFALLKTECSLVNAMSSMYGLLDRSRRSTLEGNLKRLGA
jgi:hypothetical protein